MSSAKEIHRVTVVNPDGYTTLNYDVNLDMHLASQ